MSYFMARLIFSIYFSYSLKVQARDLKFFYFFKDKLIRLYCDGSKTYTHNKDTVKSTRDA